MSSIDLNASRQSLLQQGAAQLSERELLALLLNNVHGAALFDHFGSLAALLRAGQQDFCQPKNISERAFAQKQAMLEIMRRYLRDNLQTQDALTNPRATFNYLSAVLQAYEHEVFCCLWLDNQHRAIELEQLFHGSIHSANVYPREVIKAALAHNAAAVILAHNHPSGNPEPSNADIEITKSLRSTLALIDVRLLDHFIIGSGQYVSLLERGLISPH